MYGDDQGHGELEVVAHRPGSPRPAGAPRSAVLLDSAPDSRAQDSGMTLPQMWGGSCTENDAEVNRTNE